MFDFKNIVVGSWATISTSASFGAESKTYENNPVFVMSNELHGSHRTVMLVDSKLNHLIWSDSKVDKFFPKGTLIAGEQELKVDEFTAIKKEDIDSNVMSTVIKKAEEIRSKFLKNAPDQEKIFFTSMDN